MNLKLKLKQSDLIIFLIVISSALTSFKSFVVYAVKTAIECSYVYNRGLQISTFTLITIASFCFLFLKNPRIKRNSLLNPFLILFFIGVLGIFLQPEFDNKIGFIGLFAMAIYALLYILLVNYFTIDELISGIYKSFKFLIIFEFLVGTLNSFFGITIPYISGERAATNIQIRNDILRMCGTFSHAGDFSLYITICMLFVLCRYFFEEKRKDLIYVFICYFMIYCSGARTTLLIATVGLVVVYIIKHRKQQAIYFFLIPVTIGVIIVFTQSSMYESLISLDSEEGSIWLRISFWMYGFNILIDNIRNFFIGVGINNEVLYSYNHYSELVFKLPSWVKVVYSSLYITYPVHNTFITMACELGIIGLFTYLKIYLSRMMNALKTIKTKGADPYNVFIFTALLSIIIYGMQGWAVLKAPFWVLIVIIAAFSKQYFESLERSFKKIKAYK